MSMLSARLPVLSILNSEVLGVATGAHGLGSWVLLKWTLQVGSCFVGRLQSVCTGLGFCDCHTAYVVMGGSA